MTQYLLLIFQDEQRVADIPADEMNAEHQKFIAANGTALRGGNALEPVATATSVRPDGAGGFLVTDGPFAETKEQLGGYYLVEAADLDAAIALARQVPMSAGGVEVRPIWALPDNVG
ncbi:YciI family protein [Nocardia sp. NPDC020380]|uniref:YciI family protein n=1 Tax=Nocardia sp. NPDC020380 TaxID=3364309 RepID=UPI0037B4E624